MPRSGAIRRLGAFSRAKKETFDRPRELPVGLPAALLAAALLTAALLTAALLAAALLTALAGIPALAWIAGTVLATLLGALAALLLLIRIRVLVRIIHELLLARVGPARLMQSCFHDR
jgi:hypothetical protein